MLFSIYCEYFAQRCVKMWYYCVISQRPSNFSMASWFCTFHVKAMLKLLLCSNNQYLKNLLGSAKLAHSLFHGIPWNCSCHWNWRIPSSMEFHKTDPVSEIGAPKVPWNSMEFHGTAHVIEIGTLLVPWNSMEFHGTARVSEIGATQDQWNSMELLVSAKLAHFKFHGIPWNCSCQRNWRTPSSMEFHGTARVSEIGALQVPWNSMEFHGTAGVSSMEFHGTFLCYLLEPLVSSMHWVLKWYKIPWNLSFKILMKIVFNCAGWINFHKLINTL